MLNIIKKIRGCKEYIKNSFYYKKIQDNKSIIIVSLLLAIICTLITYPGIWYSDSYSRVEFSKEIVDYVEISKNRELINLESWLTVLPSFVMAICRIYTGNIATYTVLQAFMFFLVTFLYIKKMKTFLYKFQYILFAISPLIYCVSVFYEAGIGCVVGIISFILLLDSIKCEKSILDKVIEFILLTLSSFIIFGYRANAFTIIPVIVVYIFMMNMKLTKKILTTSTLVLGIILLNVFICIFNIKMLSSMSAGFTWEIIRVIQEMNPEKQERYLDYLDEICGEGGTKIEIQSTDKDSVNSFIWTSDGINIYNLSEKGNTTKILKKYVKIILKEPKLYFKVKLEFVQRTLGINMPILCIGYIYNYDNRMLNYNFSDSIQRQQFVETYVETNERFGFFTERPWFVFLVSICLVIVKYRQKDEKRLLYIFILMISIFYYGAYIINTQSFEVRYFYPSLYLCMILDVAISLDLIGNIYKKIIRNI